MRPAARVGGCCIANRTDAHHTAIKCRRAPSVAHLCPTFFTAIETGGASKADCSRGNSRGVSADAVIARHLPTSTNPSMPRDPIGPRQPPTLVPFYKVSPAGHMPTRIFSSLRRHASGGIAATSRRHFRPPSPAFLPVRAHPATASTSITTCPRPPPPPTSWKSLLPLAADQPAVCITIAQSGLPHKPCLHPTSRFARASSQRQLKKDN
jgi:hypothetical protein